MRYKRPALESLGYEAIFNELNDIEDSCGDIRWFVESNDDTLLNALDGDEEEEYEFRMAFAELEAKTESLMVTLRDQWGVEEYFDTCTVALIGNRYNTVGYDMDEEDYISLTSYEQELAYSESGKRLMRMTKAEMLSTIGQCMGITVAFLDLRQRYDYLKATFDILRDKNTSMLKSIKEIEKAYDKAEEADFHEWDKETKKFDNLIEILPEIVWLQ